MCLWSSVEFFEREKAWGAWRHWSTTLGYFDKYAFSIITFTPRVYHEAPRDQPMGKLWRPCGVWSIWCHATENFFEKGLSRNNLSIPFCLFFLATKVNTSSVWPWKLKLSNFLLQRKAAYHKMLTSRVLIVINLQFQVSHYLHAVVSMIRGICFCVVFCYVFFFFFDCNIHLEHLDNVIISLA